MSRILPSADSGVASQHVVNESRRVDSSKTAGNGGLQGKGIAVGGAKIGRACN